MLPYLTPDEIARFWAKVLKTETCWLWQASCNNMGYGMFSVRGRAGGHMLAHRYAFYLATGSDPGAWFVCHNCPDGDNPLCVRPSHLFLGTRVMNQADMAAKGRAAVGERHGSHKLTTATVALIRTRYAAGGVLQRELAAEYGVSQQTISDILRGLYRKTA